MHRLSDRVLDVSNAFQNKNVPICERVYVSPPPYYLYWFLIYSLNFPINRYDEPFSPQRMNGIKGKKISWMTMEQTP